MRTKIEKSSYLIDLVMIFMSVFIALNIDKMYQSIPFHVLSDNLRESENKQSFYNFVKELFDLNEESLKLYKKQIDQFVTNHDLRWKKKSKFRINHFRSQHVDWLQQEFSLKNPTYKTKQLMPFEECSDRTKRRRLDAARQNKSLEEIEGTYFQVLRDTSKIDADIIKGLRNLDLSSKELILKIIHGDFSNFVKYTPDEALALMIDLKLSKFQYELLHSQAKKKFADIYPPYYKIFEAKTKCYPSKDDMSISEMGAKIAVQSLLNHTMERVVESCDPNVLKKIVEPELQATYKWGFDGASGQSLYKQAFKGDSENSTDASIVMVSLIPLQVNQLNSPSTIIWKNTQPSSTRLCRPIQFEFMKESKATSIETHDYIQQQVNSLKSTLVNNDGKVLTISHKLHGSMFDGKAINHLSDGSSESCNICKAKPTEMANHELLLTKICNGDNYSYGISSLHCWIRFFECIIHIAYKLPIGRRSAYTVEHKEMVKERKREIQIAFKEKGNAFEFEEVTRINLFCFFHIVSLTFSKFSGQIFGNSFS